MTSRHILPIGALLLLTIASARGQTPSLPSLLIGPVAGLDASVQSARIPVYAGSPDCGEFTGGSGLRPSLGIAIVAPGLFSDRFGLSIAAGMALRAGTFDAPPAEPFRVVDDLTGRLVELDKRYRLDFSEWSGSLDLLARYGIAGRWALGAGISAGYTVASTYEQSDNIFGPGLYRFPDGRSTHTMTDGTPIVPSGFTFGPTVTASYELSLSAGTVLQPGLALHTEILSPARDLSWQRFELGGRIALLFGSVPAPIETPPPAQPSAEPARPRLVASIGMSGRDEENLPVPLATVRVNELISRQVAPLLPAVFFDRDALTLPGRYARLDPAGADTFAIADLAGVDILHIQHHALDVIGLRMREHPEARLDLTGSVSRDETTKLIRPRAEQVRDYLETVWRIDRSRMAIHESNGFMLRSNESTEDGRGDNRRVEIASNVGAVMAPVVTEQVARDFNPPIIRLDPAVESEAGIKSWSIVVTQGRRRIASYSDRDGGSPSGSEMMWRIDRTPIDSLTGPIVAELRVEDSAGGSARARAEVPLTVERKVRVIDGRIEHDGGRERIAYMLVGFDFNSSDPGAQNESALRDIASLARQGARIAIIGYTDRIGLERRNEELSSARANRVADLLRGALEERGIHPSTLKVTGGGSETHRFTNDLPEGRVLSRGVAVSVEQDDEGIFGLP